MQKQFNNYDDDQKTTQQQSWDSQEVMFADQNQESNTDFSEPEEPDYIVNEQEQDEVVNEEEDALPGNSDRPGEMQESDDDEEEDDDDYKADEDAGDEDATNIDIKSGDDIEQDKHKDDDIL